MHVQKTLSAGAGLIAAEARANCRKILANKIPSSAIFILHYLPWYSVCTPIPIGIDTSRHFLVYRAWRLVMLLTLTVCRASLSVLLSSKTGFQQPAKLRNKRSRSSPGNAVTQWIITESRQVCSQVATEPRVQGSSL